MKSAAWPACPVPGGLRRRPGDAVVVRGGGTQWVRADLGGVFDVSRVRLDWEAAWAVDYQVQLADDAAGPWRDLAAVAGNDAAANDLAGLSGTGRYLRLYCTQTRPVSGNYSVFDV